MEIICKTKRQPTEWEKIFSYNIIDKALIYKALVWVLIRAYTTQYKKNQKMDRWPK